jgi:Fe-Mn family superoxide dismutase
MKINNLIKLADELDKKGLLYEASELDNFIKSAAEKQNLHSCGLKEESVEFHKKLLDGYKKAFEETKKDYKRAMQSSNETDSPNEGMLRAVLKNKTHNANAISLHEMYFADLCDSKPYPLSKVPGGEEALKQCFSGGYKQLEKEMRRAAMTSRNGWVVLTFCTIEKCLYINMFDLHDIGTPLFSIPILALDMWEHAYINDFATNKEAYLDWYFEHLDWRNPTKRLKNLNKLK